MTVVILGSRDDEHAAHTAAYLQTLGTDAEFLDSLTFPTELGMEFRPDSRSGSLILPCGRPLAFEEIQSVYWRNYGGPSVVDLPDAEQAYIAANDARGALESLLISLPTRWVNGWEGYNLHQTKPAALAKVAAAGVRVPKTLISNDPEAVREFASAVPNCIFKPVQGGAHTRRLSPEMLTDNALQRLRVTPVTIQEEILGQDIRVFVAGEEIHACEISTDAIDFRDDQAALIHPVALPDEVAADCRLAAETLHLLWTGIDLRRTDAGEYVFLEANPSPMFIGFEERTGLPLTAALGRLLLGE